MQVSPSLYLLFSGRQILLTECHVELSDLNHEDFVLQSFFSCIHSASNDVCEYTLWR